MSKLKRVRRGASGWRDLIARQAVSGVTVAEFCRREGIHAGLFRRWRSTVDQRAANVVATRDSGIRAKSMASFIDLGPLDSRASRFDVRLELGDGMVLHLVRG
jgi:putative transposase